MKRFAVGRERQLDEVSGPAWRDLAVAKKRWHRLGSSNLNLSSRQAPINALQPR
jgi:hypothetical protein